MVYNYLKLKHKENNSLFFMKNEKVYSLSKKIGLNIRNINFLNILNLRGDYKSSSFQKSFKNIFDIQVPKKVGFFSNNKDLILISLGPNEILMVNINSKNLLSKKNYYNSLEKICFVTEVSDHYHCLNLSGDKLRWILSKGCPVDLDETSFYPGRCFQTLLGNSNIIMICNEDSSINIICIASYADYILSWLKDASQEHGYNYFS